MKTESFILLFCLLSICFTQDSENQCETQFLSILETKCLGLGSSCAFNTANKKCLPISSCSGKSEDDCPNTIPSNYHYKKCKYDSGNSSCNEVNKVCSDYNKAVDGYAISGDECSSLTKETGEGDRCLLFYPNGNLVSKCSTHYNSCSSINEPTKCEANIPSDLTKKCLLNSDSQCVEANRTCTEYQYLYEWANKANCNKLEAIDASKGASCVYAQNGGCIEAYPCSYWDNKQANCDDKTPLNDAKDDYDYLYKCKYNTANNKCEKVRKTCTDYNSLLIGDADCSQFSPEDSTNKKCVYSSSSEECIEQYKTCQLYDENDAEKSRDECEGLILDDPNKKCVYIKEEHKCEEGNVYNNCNEYKGSDRKICERILSPKRNSYCVLDKDSVCKERDFFCVEAYDRYDCLIYAKPTDDTKKCVWDLTDFKCKEKYKGCEDYVEKRSDSETTCDGLEVYNGKKCYYNSDKCTSKNKICSEAKSKEECKLIEKTGVSDPDRKYCEWYSTSHDTGSYCRETYKYCSDYRPISTSTSSSGSLSSTTCEKIKPFNPETNTLDLAYKCAVKDTSVGCEKVPKECREAGTNKILCDLISPLIKDNRIKYCAFIQGTCVEHYNTCELVDELKSNFENLCKNNIPNNHYFPGICEYTNDNGKYKCKTKSTSFCNLFNTITYQDYKYLCLSINPNCSYSGGSCKNITKSCTDIKFYTQDDNNKAICEAIKLSDEDEDKICVLKEDKSGCEIVYRESIPFIYADNANSNSNSAFKLNANGMQIILILLSLLF
jgi:hypothetical protein